KVLLAGGLGRDGTQLQSAEIFDPETNGFSPARSAMLSARVNARLNVLPDGKVQVIGGDDESTMEMFNAEGEYFTAKAHLLTGQGSLSATLGTESRAALFQADSSRRLAIRDEAGASFESLLDRKGHTLTQVPQASMTLAAGGVRSDGVAQTTAVLFSSSGATVTTDKTDYAPGETVTITGAGWERGETANMVLHREPETQPDTTLSSVADASGNFTNDTFVVSQLDLGVTFMLTATGATSGYTAQTTFTDAELVTAEVTGATNEVTVTQGGPSGLSTINVSATGNLSNTVTSGNPSTAKIYTSYTFTVGSLSFTNLSGALNFWAGSSGCSGNNCDVIWTGFSTPYSISASISADALTPANNYTIALSTAAGTTKVTNPNPSGGKLADD